MVNLKHITFQRIWSQSGLVEFKELDSSLENSPAVKGSESEDKGTPSRSPGTALEKSELTDKKRPLESPGNSPSDKKIVNYPEVGDKSMGFR